MLNNFKVNQEISSLYHLSRIRMHYLIWSALLKKDFLTNFRTCLCLQKNFGYKWICPFSVSLETSCIVANMLNCDIVVSKFELKSHYYVHFQINTFGKGMKPLIPSSYVLDISTTILQW